MAKILLLVIALLLSSCATGGGPKVESPRLVDAKATAETRALFINLKRLSADRILFGHHDDLAYGVHWTGQRGRSDVREASGSYPAVYGWDVARLFRRNDPDTPDPQRAEQLRRWILEGYARGGVITLAWHMANPVNDKDSWNTEPAVAAILPGGRLHPDYRSKLDVVAAFVRSLRTAEGTAIPVIFRPFHEHNGSWFWWGRPHSSIEQFQQLWRFTVEHLRDRRRVRNLLYAYSTDVFDIENEYLERYPGDAYVDLLGFDDYHSVKSIETRQLFINRLRLLTSMAEARGKLAALTETGVEGVPDPKWWTGTLLPALKSPGVRLSYVLVWRNAHAATDRRNHFYAPFAGHPSAEDFVRFRNDPRVLFEDELPNLYIAH